MTSCSSNSEENTFLGPTHIPAALRGRAQWVVWRYQTRGGKPTKVPADPRTGKHASFTNPATWARFDNAVAAWRANDRYAGVGFVFSSDDPFAGIDLDGCIDGSGDLVDSAKEIVDSLNSYTESSPSGRGVKVFIIGAKSAGLGCRTNKVIGFEQIELYSNARFFTVTGRHVPSTPATVEERQTQLEALCGRLWPRKNRSSSRSHAAAAAGFDGDDEVLIEKAASAENGDLFKRLWAGDAAAHADDGSAADLALRNLLAFWTARDADRMDRLIRCSGLFREKWDERRGERTYGQMTIDRAIADCTEVYTPRRQPDRKSSASPESGTVTDDHGQEQCAIALGQCDPVTGRVVLSPRRTLPTAKAPIYDCHRRPDGRTLHNYAGLLLEWRGNRYCQTEAEAVKHHLQPWLHAALRYLVNKHTGELELVDFESNPSTVKQALKTFSAYAHLPATTITPSWLDDGKDHPPALEILPCKSASLHSPTGRVLPATPALFTINALDFDYDPDSEPPERWIKFLNQLWGDDLESSELLQEWFGYCLTADTSQQKMLLLVGPRRSGTGTIGRILTRLVGAANVVGPTTSSLAGAFGLQPLIDKSLAIVSDARFTGDSVSTVVERLLCISGEDMLSIDRKFFGSVSLKLPTRFMFLTNELPRLNDVSAALAGRFLVLRLSRSFYGEEDIALTHQLLAELPGVLLWAIEGWKRLQRRGHLVQPTSVEDAIRELEDLASPVGAFVRDRCAVGPGKRASVDDLYRSWRTWCECDGRQIISSKMSFGRDLATAVPGIRRRRGSGLVSFYEGTRFSADGRKVA